jgi:hypothetical protein
MQHMKNLVLFLRIQTQIYLIWDLTKDILMWSLDKFKEDLSELEENNCHVERSSQITTTTTNLLKA